MKKCPNCGRTFLDSAEKCSECNRVLISCGEYEGTHSEEDKGASSSIFKTNTVIMAILFFVAGIVAGFLFKIVDEDSIFTEEKFNYILMIAVWFSGVLPVFASYAMYAHFKNQETLIHICLQIRDNQRKTERLEDTYSTNEPIENEPSEPEIPLEPPVEDKPEYIQAHILNEDGTVSDTKMKTASFTFDYTEYLHNGELYFYKKTQDGKTRNVIVTKTIFDSFRNKSRK